MLINFVTSQQSPGKALKISSYKVFRDFTFANEPLITVRIAISDIGRQIYKENKPALFQLNDVITEDVVAVELDLNPAIYGEDDQLISPSKQEYTNLRSMVLREARNSLHKVSHVRVNCSNCKNLDLLIDFILDLQHIIRYLCLADIDLKKYPRQDLLRLMTALKKNSLLGLEIKPCQNPLQAQQTLDTSTYVFIMENMPASVEEFRYADENLLENIECLNYRWQALAKTNINTVRLDIPLTHPKAAHNLAASLHNFSPKAHTLLINFGTDFMLSEEGRFAMIYALTAIPPTVKTVCFAWPDHFHDPQFRQGSVYPDSAFIIQNLETIIDALPTNAAQLIDLSVNRYSLIVPENPALRRILHTRIHRVANTVFILDDKLIANNLREILLATIESLEANLAKTNYEFSKQDLADVDEMFIFLRTCKPYFYLKHYLAGVESDSTIRHAIYLLYGLFLHAELYDIEGIDRIRQLFLNASDLQKYLQIIDLYTQAAQKEAYTSFVGVLLWDMCNMLRSSIDLGDLSEDLIDSAELILEKIKQSLVIIDVDPHVPGFKRGEEWSPTSMQEQTTPLLEKLALDQKRLAALEAVHALPAGTPRKLLAWAFDINRLSNLSDQLDNTRADIDYLNKTIHRYKSAEAKSPASVPKSSRDCGLACGIPECTIS